MELLSNSLPAFLTGIVVGILAMAIFNKLRGGAANPATTKDAFDQYKADVAEHFTETGKQFQSMASQYQELYEHLAVGAHTLLDNETADKMLAPPSKPSEPSQSSASASKTTASNQRATPEKNQKTANAASSKNEAKGDVSKSHVNKNGVKPSAKPSNDNRKKTP